MYSTEKDLEPVDDHWPLLQYQCFFSGHGGFQCRIRLRDPVSPHAISLEIANAQEKEDSNNHSFCDRLFVSSCSCSNLPCTLGGRNLTGRMDVKCRCFSRNLTISFTLRACVTSILRTYYAWQIVKSPDVTYNMLFMGLWAYAEISIGIIVSCLPVFPKFLKHINLKVFSVGSLSETGLRHKLPFIGNTDKTNASPGSGRPYGKPNGASNVPKMWNQSYQPESELKGAYITINDDMQQTKSAATNGLTPTLAAGSATKREEIENGLA